MIDSGAGMPVDKAVCPIDSVLRIQPYNELVLATGAS